jgi:hypothetical protein
MEAEYVALSEATCEAVWLKNILSELGLSQTASINIRGNNEGSVAMVKNLQFHKHSKHIMIKWHWVREVAQSSMINIKNCCDLEQTADMLTKPLPHAKHKHHVFEMGLSPN